MVWWRAGLRLLIVTLPAIARYHRGSIGAYACQTQQLRNWDQTATLCVMTARKVSFRPYLCRAACGHPAKSIFFAPLQLGEAVTRTSRVQSITEKSGGSGQLVFVDVAHETFGEAGMAVREVQSIVYRSAAAACAALSPPENIVGSFDAEGWSKHRMLVPTETLLFRFSALTFNSHRIHYDLPYTQGEERYRGLVVHGPLTATFLLDLARRELGDNALAHFSYRGLSPAICGEALHLVMRGSGDEIEMAAFAADGRQVTAAAAQRKQLNV